MKALADCRLYTFVDTTYLRARAPAFVARELCDGGSDLIQLRAKGAPLEEVREIALQLLPILESADVGLVINDYPQLAHEMGAPLCHLGQEDFFGAGHRNVAELKAADGVRLRPGAPLQIGLSTHSPAQAERARAAGADYLAIGPVFATPTKPSAAPVTLEYVRWAAQNLSVPWFAIGGITLNNLETVMEAGARRVCVVSAILTSADVAKTCQEFKDRLLSAGREL